MIAILYNIRSIYNVGSIFRTADSAGIEKIYLCGITPSPINKSGKKIQQMSKVALGAEKVVEWEYRKSAITLIKRLKNNGYFVISAEQTITAKQYYEVKKYIKKSTKIAVVFGSEVDGVPENILSISDLVVEIPTFGKKDSTHKYKKKIEIKIGPNIYTDKESLNVSVSFGIIIFEILRNKILR